MAKIIYLKFLRLKPEKQERILNAGMKEFAQKGFKNASTEVIAKEADISKGALFHYFNNKKDLFLFLYDYALSIVKNEIITKLDFNEKDIFNRRRQALLLKIEVLKKHPELYDFLAAVYLEDSIEVKNQLENKNKEVMATGQSKLYEGIDTSKFKAGIEAKKAIEIITWTIEGFTNKEKERIKSLSLNEIDYNEMLDELDVYLEILKESFYK